MFPKYPKINTLFKRETEKPCRIILGEYALEEYPNIKYWQVQEKVDGVNVRINFDCGQVEIGGKNDNTQLSSDLLFELRRLFTVEKMKKQFPYVPFDSSVTLYGEGYGAGIQKGANYRPKPGFILFDVLIDNLWLKRVDCVKIADALSLPIVPLIVNWMTLSEIIEFVRSKPNSHCSLIKQPMEGIVAKTDLLLRNGERVWFKLKVSDFKDSIDYKQSDEYKKSMADFDKRITDLFMTSNLPKIVPWRMK